MTPGVRRRQIGVYAWLGLAACTALWLYDARASVIWLTWLMLLLPFLTLLPGLRGAHRNSWLLALLFCVGYTTIGIMDMIANPDSNRIATVLAGAGIVTFFLLIPAIRTMPAPPRPSDDG